MRVELHESPLPPEVRSAYDVFEREFTYPLGPGRSFRISHDGDPRRFFESMGRSACVIASDEAGVCGSGSIALRTVRIPGGEKKRIAYLGDFKVARRARGGRCLLQLAQAIFSWGKAHTGSGIAVVMDGTQRTPDQYTGRCGIPHFEPLAGASVLLVTDGGTSKDPREARPSTRGEVERLHAGLLERETAVLAGDPALRSLLPPEWIALEDGSACACLEDTRRAKRLVDDHGKEIVSLHLSSFAFRHASDGAALIRAALRKAGAQGAPQLFATAPRRRAEGLRQALCGLGCVDAPATIYGAGLNGNEDWWINPSEI